MRIDRRGILEKRLEQVGKLNWNFVHMCLGGRLLGDPGGSGGSGGIAVGRMHGYCSRLRLEYGKARREEDHDHADTDQGYKKRLRTRSLGRGKRWPKLITPYAYLSD